MLSAEYFIPLPAAEWAPQEGCWSSACTPHLPGQFPDWAQADLLLMGAPDLPGRPSGAAALRAQLYAYSLPHPDLRVADLGDLPPAASPEGASEALAHAGELAARSGKPLAILGGPLSLGYGQYLSLAALPGSFEYALISGALHLRTQETLSDAGFCRSILAERPFRLRHAVLLGGQRYLYTQAEQSEWQAQHFSLLRYGELSERIERAEPYLRTAAAIQFSLSALRASEAPGAELPSPGGFTLVEACRLARYAGMGYHARSLLLSGWRPEADSRGQTAAAAALLLWYFAEGLCSRYQDWPLADRSNLRQYTVQMNEPVGALHFFFHPATGRWWMEGPGQAEGTLIPCTEEDYRSAQEDDIPDRWWQLYNKLNP
jgi:arginase family enzyme